MFLDIGFGILSAIIVANVFSIKLTLLLIGFGIIFALLPDADFIYVLMRSGYDHRAISRHREFLHYPLIYLPLGGLLLFFFKIEWSVLFLLTSLAHFLHDSIGIGWGIPWFWPFATHTYSFFYKYIPRYHATHPRKLIYVWEKEKLDELIEKYGDPNWFRNIYLRLHPFSIIEFLGFITSLIILYLYFKF